MLILTRGLGPGSSPSWLLTGGFVSSDTPSLNLGTGDPDPYAFDLYGQGPDPYRFTFD